MHTHTWPEPVTGHEPMGYEYFSPYKTDDEGRVGL
jgi:hypothetical protein